MPLDLLKIREILPGSAYDRKKFAAMTIRIANPNCTLLLFSSGKLVVTGARNFYECLLASLCVSRILRDAFPSREFHLVNCEIQNIVAHVELPIGEGVLDLQHTGFDGGEIQACAADEGHHTGPHALDGHSCRGDPARHLSDHVRESHTVRRGEATLAQPFGVDRRKDRQQAGGHDFRRQQTGVVEEHGARTLSRSHDGHRLPDGGKRLAHVRAIQQTQHGVARAT
jgi:hypothetical protein